MYLLSTDFIVAVKKVMTLEYLKGLIGLATTTQDGLMSSADKTALDGLGTHNHDDRYYTEAESDAKYSLTTHNHDGTYSPVGHNHDATYAPIVHTHDDRYFTETESDARFAPIVHDHDARYYTETEIDAAFAALSSTYAPLSHTHSDKLDTSEVSQNATALTVVRRTNEGDVYARLLRSEFTGATTSAAYVMGQHALGSGGADNYVRPIAVSQLASQVQQQSVFSVINGAANSLYRLGIYRFSTTTNVTSTKWHFKTNYTMNDRMVMLEIKGYEYGASKPIDSRYACYPYSAVNDIINKGGASNNTHTMNAYKSSDGYLCFSIDLASAYYVGGVLNVFEANPPSPNGFAITASGFSSSATAY